MMYQANKMVAQERIKCAEMEEELENARREGEALKGALKIIELENGQLRSLSSSGGPVPTETEHLPELSPVSPFVASMHSPEPSEESTILHSAEDSQPGSGASSPLTLKSPHLHPFEPLEESPWDEDT